MAFKMAKSTEGLPPAVVALNPLVAGSRGVRGSGGSGQRGSSAAGGVEAGFGAGVLYQALRVFSYFLYPPGQLTVPLAGGGRRSWGWWSGLRACDFRALPDLEPAHDALLLGRAVLVIPRLAPQQVESVQPILKVVKLCLQLLGVHLSRAGPSGGRGRSAASALPQV